MPLSHVIAAHKSWAKTPNRTARTTNGRNAFEQKFLAEADGDPQRAESLRKAYFLELAQKSAVVRQRNRDAKEAARKARIAALIAESDGDAA